MRLPAYFNAWLVQNERPTAPTTLTDPTLHVRFTPRCLVFPNILLSGAVAQLGARVNGIHEVAGSIPASSTNYS